MGFRDCVIHTAEEIERIRVAAAKTAEVRDQLAELVLKMKLQNFGHLIRRTDSLEKTLILGKIEGRRRRG